MFFIEDNTDDYSERYAAVKISLELITSLEDRQEKDLRSNNNLYDYLKRIFPDLLDADISQILHEGKLEYSGTLTIARVIKGVYNFNTFLLRIATFIPFYETKTVLGKNPIKLISDALGWVVEHLEEIKVDDYRWDPTADKLDENGKPDDTYKKEQDFSPFLLPGIEEAIDTGSDKMKAEFKKITASFLVQMNSQDDSVRQFLGIEGSFTENSLPNTILEFVYLKYRGVTLAIKKQLTQLENIDFTDFAKLGVRIINAFLCGLWNGLIDAVCGLIMMVKYIFDAILLIDDFMDNIYTELPKLTEHMDNLRQGIEGIDLGKIMSHIIKGFATFIGSGSDAILIKMAYFAGAVYGFVISLVVEIAIGILVSGGVLSIEAIIEKLVEIFTSLLRAVPNIAKGILKGATKITVKGLKFLYKMLTELTAFLKKGTDEIIKVIDELFIHIREINVLNNIFDKRILYHIKTLNLNPAYVHCIELVNKNRFFGMWVSIEYEAMIKLYTSNTHVFLNNALRGLRGVKLTTEFRAMQKVLDRALEKLPISEFNNQVLKRSAFFTENEIKKLFKAGGKFTDKGFMSTTYSERSLKQWMISNPTHNVVFKVFGKNGKLIQQASMLPHEAEVLFKSGTVFSVESIGKIYHPVVERARNGEKVFEIILKEK